jgi:cytochrome c551/c552
MPRGQRPWRRHRVSDPTWQKSVTDDYIVKIIKVGGAGVGKSAAMPSNPDIRNADVLAALKNKVRGFAGK